MKYYYAENAVYAQKADLPSNLFDELAEHFFPAIKFDDAHSTYDLIHDTHPFIRLYSYFTPK